MKDLDMTKREEQYLDALREAVGVVSDLYIAGGYLRDTLLGKPIKDIDLYVYFHTEADRQQFLKLSSFQVNSNSDYEEGDLYFTGTWKNTRINVIAPKNEWRVHFNTFDIGLCKVYYNLRTDTLVRSYDFNRDVEGRTLTLLCSGDMYSEHTRRLVDKYPEYTVRDHTGVPF